uniref:Uncharacterized LOC100178871 n=1 Tax=Ciona intestinalis TaxID=7719 RepID=H2XT10_CIOIN|nr:uncharacterized protein LOC100178871 [Ciona intestinalis]|eukprot:XP_002127257.1 uncharacterized protein LOC100178871 [Ciona intestinalis]
MMHIEQTAFMFFMVIAVSTGCKLKTYGNSYVVGYNSQVIRVEDAFVGSMKTISNSASTCNVTVIVTSSFRKQSQPVPGHIVPPASRSNHLVGHAIDMNLKTPKGYCNSRCLAARKNSHAECFLKNVMGAGLRWGGTWNQPDPVHIDDSLNLRSPKTWESLFYDLQRHC